MGWKVGDNLETLRKRRQRAENLGCSIEGTSDHMVSQSLYLLDPDGNEVELFVDNPDYDWHNDQGWMEKPVLRPLKL